MARTTPSQNDPTLARRVGAALGLPLGAALGAAAGVWFAAPRAASPGEEPRAAFPVAPTGDSELASGELARALVDLTGELARLRARLDRLEMNPPSARAPVVAGEERATEAAAETEVRALTATLDSLARRLENAADQLAGSGHSGIRMPSEPANPAPLIDLAERYSKEWEVLGVDHAFWSARRVLETYGRPCFASGTAIHYGNLALPDGRTALVAFSLGASGYVSSLDVRYR